MHIYVIFIILLQHYEKAVHVPNYRFFWKELSFNYYFKCNGSKAELSKSNLFWVGQHEPPAFILEEELI